MVTQDINSCVYTVQIYLNNYKMKYDTNVNNDLNYFFGFQSILSRSHIQHNTSQPLGLELNKKNDF